MLSKKILINPGLILFIFLNFTPAAAQNNMYQLGEELVNIAKSGNTDKLVDYIDDNLKIDDKAKIMESFLVLREQIFTILNKDKIQLFNVLMENNNIYIILTDNTNYIIIKSTINENNKITGRFSYENSKIAKELAKGSKIYKTRCYSCHGKFAKGSIGPNLTDNYWKYVNSPQDLYEITAKGKKGTMMIAYKNYLKPDEIQAVITYIKALQNKKLINAKKPEGEKKDFKLSVFH